jgi:hypothetical protein
MSDQQQAQQPQSSPVQISDPYAADILVRQAAVQVAAQIVAAQEQK